MAEGKLFQLRGNGALHAARQAHGQEGVGAQARHLGRILARLRQRARVRDAAPPRARSEPGGVVALRASDGKILWRRPLAVAHRVLAAVRQRPRLLRLRERHRLRAARGRRRRALDVQGRRARSRAGSRWPTASSTSATTAVACTRSGRPNGSQGVEHRHQGLDVRPARRPLLLDAGGRLRPRLHRQHRRQDVLVLVGERQAGLDARGPAPTCTPRPRSRRCRVCKPTVYFGSYDGVFYALDARNGKVRWTHTRRRQDLRRRDRRRRHRLLLEPGQEGHHRARRAHRERGLPHGPRRRSTRSSPTGARSS